MTGLILMSLVSCDSGGAQGVRQIEDQRELQTAGNAIPWNATTGERFGLGTIPPAAPTGPQRLTWETPEGWIEQPPTSFRAVNFTIPGEEPAECYLVALPGDAGGIVPNVNRWRQQMELPAADAEEIAALPRWPFFGREGVHVDFVGPFTGMDGQRNENTRMLGLLLIDPQGSIFLKMIGPKGVVDAEAENFRALAESFVEPFTEVDPHAGHGHGPGEHGDPGGSGQSAPGVLTWEAPEGWTRAPQRQMRVVSFFVDAEQSVECYITAFPGDGGGPLANINRWRNQMGQDELGPEALMTLERVPMLGGEGLVVEIEGSSEASSVEDAMLLGTVCNIGEQAVFVKMLGSKSVVEPAKNAFLSFCQSIQRAH